MSEHLCYPARALSRIGNGDKPPNQEFVLARNGRQPCCGACLVPVHAQDLVGEPRGAVYAVPGQFDPPSAVCIYQLNTGPVSSTGLG